jgi:CheY-like chemotaxis protein
MIARSMFGGNSNEFPSGFASSHNRRSKGHAEHLARLASQDRVDDVIEANNGQQALELLTTADDPGIDVILCDLFMGVMDGMTFCQNVRLNTALRKKHIPILILTAERDPFLLSVLREVGVSDIAHKPISASELQPRIEKLIGLNAEPKAQEHGAGSRM